jgi:hypothetical protein
MIFSVVFEAEDVVGRIIRARKLSSAGAVCLGRLCRDGCFFNVEVEGLPRAGRSMSSLDDLWWGSCFCDRLAWLRARDTVLAAGARDWRFGAAAVATFERDEAVGAVIDAGSFAGLVGDFGLGLWKPVDGEVWGGLFSDVLATVEEVVGRAAGLVVVELAVDLVAIISAGFAWAFVLDDAAGLEVGALLDLPGVVGVFAGVVGVLGFEGDFVDLETGLAVAEGGAVEMGPGLTVRLAGAVFAVPLAGEAGLSFPLVFPFKFSINPPFFNAAPPLTAAVLVVSPGRSFVLRSSTDVFLSGFAPGIYSVGVTFPLQLLPLR